METLGIVKYLNNALTLPNEISLKEQGGIILHAAERRTSNKHNTIISKKASWLVGNTFHLTLKLRRAVSGLCIRASCATASNTSYYVSNVIFLPLCTAGRGIPARLPTFSRHRD